MTTDTTLQSEDNPLSNVLYISFELSKKSWKLGFSDGDFEHIKIREISSRDIEQLAKEVRWAEEYFDLAEDYEIRSCYEAGLDGFWLHRVLGDLGIQNIVVDPASIEVRRRKRRRKTDRLDARRLVCQLIRYVGGDTRVWSVCQVPTRQDEDDRRIERELKRLKNERTQHVNRIKGLLSTRGLYMEVNDELIESLDELVGRDRAGLGNQLKREIRREYERIQMVDQHIKAVEKERAHQIKQRRDDEKIKKVKFLEMLHGIGEDSAWLLVMEMFGWRQFDNRGQVGSYSGLTPTPHDTGQSRREQGICKAGNKWVRGRMVQLAWLWLQYQPDSELSQWYQRRFGDASRRQKRVGIVALARKLLVRLWRFVEDGEVPNGAVLTQS